MKTLTLIAATGSLAALAAPASAATSPLELELKPSVQDMMVVPSAMSFDIGTVSYIDDDDWDDDDYRYRRGRGYRDRHVYDRRGRYREPRRINRRDRVWRGRDGRYYCERENGTTGLVIGAVGGALLGRVIDRDGDRTVGTLLGGALGAVLGREIERSGARCR